MIVQGLQQAYQNLFHMFAEFLPRFVVMLVIIVSGLLVAYALKYVVRTTLRLTKLDRLSDEAGASRVLRMAALPSMSELLSRSIFWISLAGFILVGLSVLNIAGLQEQVSRFLHLLPEIVIAMVILFFGLIIANFFSRRTARGGQCRILVAEGPELVDSLCHLDSSDYHGAGRVERGARNGDCRVLYCIWRADAWVGDCLWPGRPAART
jgi:hypothetical protein